MLEKAKDKIFVFFEKWGKKIGLDLPYFVKNGFWMFLKQFVLMLCGIVVSIFFARVAAKEIYGGYQFFVSIFSIMSILSIPGLNNSILLAVSRGFEGDYKKAIKASFSWSLIGVPILFLIGTYYYQSNQQLGLALMIFSVFFPFFYAPNTWNAFLQGKKRYKEITVYSSVQIVLNAAATIAVVYFSKDNLFLIIMTHVISYVFFNIYYYYKSLKFIENNKTDPETIKYGFFLTKMNFSEMIAENLDKLIIGMFISPTALAAFAIISMIPIKTKALLKACMQVIFPKMAEENFKLNDFAKQKRKILYFLLFFAIFVGLIYYFIADKLNMLVFGSNYADYYSYSGLFAIYLVTCIPSIFLSWHAQAKKMRRIILFSNPIFFIFKTLITVSLVFYLGLYGAVLAYNINSILLLLVFLFFLPKKIATVGA